MRRNDGQAPSLKAETSAGPTNSRHKIQDATMDARKDTPLGKKNKPEMSLAKKKKALVSRGGEKLEDVLR